MQRIHLVALASVVALLAVAVTAQAHVTHLTDDEAYFITIGQQGEPVYTFQRTNLDLIIRINEDGERGAEVGGVHETLTATLIAPGGEELQGTLTVQRGSEGRYQFDGGYTLTEPGVYTLRLVGTINDTPVNDVYAMPHEIYSQADVMFPDQGLPTLKELDARLQALENGSGERAVPGPALVAVLAALGAVAVVLRRNG
jgi:hypothetical protein